MMKNMIKVQVTKVEWSPTFGSDVVVLKEMNGNRYSYIPLRDWEAQAINVRLEQSSQERYKTGWLLSYILENSDIKILKVELKKTQGSEMMAEIIYYDRDQTKSITHSPGEAIELAMRCRSAIFVKETLLSVLETAEQQSWQQAHKIQELKGKLEKAVELEDYEKAARLRDRISQMEKEGNH